MKDIKQRIDKPGFYFWRFGKWIAITEKNYFYAFNNGHEILHVTSNKQ